MMKKIVFVFLALILVSSPAFAALSVDDFLPPIQASNEAEMAERLKVTQPGEVKEVVGEITGKPAISALSPQDAVNSWVDRRTQGFEEVLFPNGFGFVSTGISIYELHENPVAARISKRDAYVRAYMQAKRQLAEGLNGVVTSGNTKAFESLATVNESMGQTLVNEESITTEAIQQRVDGFLRGFVVYDVYDDVKAQRVFLTIVSTPGTQGRCSRPDASSISAVSMQEGLAQVLAEVENGLTPPVGGMTVFVPATGELAFVGFGSAVIGRQDSAAVQARLELNGERIAKMRAKDALCGLIVGEQFSGTETMGNEVSAMSKTFDELTMDDPAVKNDPNHPGYVKLRDRKTTFRATESVQTVMKTAREGVLPPGVRQQSWMDEDKAFSYAVAIYIPSVSEMVTKEADDIRNQRPVEQPAAPKTPAAPEEEIKQGPSGKVQKIDGLF